MVVVCRILDKIISEGTSCRKQEKLRKTRMQFQYDAISMKTIMD